MTLAGLAEAEAQEAPTMPAAPPAVTPPAGMLEENAGGTPPADGQPAAKKPKEPKAGDFDAGGKVRLPSGPDEDGKFATFNWVAVDAQAKYFVFPTVTLTGTMPIALIKPDRFGADPMTGMGGIEPKMIGGWTFTLEAKLPKMPTTSMMKYETEVKLLLTGVYMREGALLLSEKDFPLFTGGFHPGFSGGLFMKVKMSSVIDLTLAPVWCYQAGSAESAEGVQIPLSLVVGLGDLIKVSADLGIYNGDDYSFSGDNGGRISAGGALDVRLGKIAVHAGAGVASLLGGGAYPTIRDSFYIDLNVKYVK